MSMFFGDVEFLGTEAGISVSGGLAETSEDRMSN